MISEKYLYLKKIFVFWKHTRVYVFYSVPKADASQSFSEDKHQILSLVTTQVAMHPVETEWYYLRNPEKIEFQKYSQQ